MVWTWGAVAGGVSLAGAPITALPSVKVGTLPGEELAVFVAGYGSPGSGGGVVYATGGTPGPFGAWGGWAPVCDRQTLIGAPVEQPNCQPQSTR
jgi:hypothetical protein